MDNTLTGRCMVAYTDAAPGAVCNRLAIRAVIEHLAAELTLLGHHDAARSLLAQLNAQVIPLRPTTQEPA
ncbi:MAG: hypothetical protein ACO218_10910 [Steroidobacteraceae bacterium]